jgi:LPPG:FO 2-phospho-L-lactate transferase
MNVVALCGGIGGAKLALGLYHTLKKNELTIICNTGDDIELFGLHISPDVDIVMYTLAGLVDNEKGWGFKDDSFSFLNTLSDVYQQEKWFTLGDRDLATHVLRTCFLSQGMSLSKATTKICGLIGLVDAKLIPMSDELVTTKVRVSDNSLIHFEEFFVRLGCNEEIKEVQYVGAEKAVPAIGVLDALNDADLIVICPSNPIASIGPILSVRQIASALRNAKCPVIGISPLIGGEAIKGPTVEFMNALGVEASAVGVAKHYREYLSHFILDSIDRDLESEIRKLGLKTIVTNTIMKTLEDKKELARTVLSIMREPKQ